MSNDEAKFKDENSGNANAKNKSSGLLDGLPAMQNAHAELKEMGADAFKKKQEGEVHEASETTPKAEH